MLRILLISVLLILAALHSAQAQTPPLPERKVSLDSIEQDIQAEKQEQETLEGKLAEIENELESTRSALVRIARDIQDNENDLALLENRIEKLSEEEKALTTRLEEDYGSIAGLILALERMRRIPPESLIVRPGAPLQTAQTAMLLQSTLPAVNSRAEQISSDLKRLGQITTSLQNDRKSALAKKQDLARKHAETKELVDRRENLYGKLQGDYEENKRRVARLSREAKTLMDLITRLEKEEQNRQVTKVGMAVHSLPETGRARLPVTGQLVEAFGQANAIGAVSQGVTLESRPGSLVVAPMGGIVRFSGTFKNYGNMVIIEHKNGYHSLIAGIHRIDAGVGNPVKPGEPIGQLPLTSSRGGLPALYYELRYKGQPVNPAGTFSELKI